MSEFGKQLAKAIEPEFAGDEPVTPHDCSRTPAEFSGHQANILDGHGPAPSRLHAQSGWHILRHTFGAHCTMAGVHPRRLQTWMGHSSLKVTERYAHLAPDQDRDIDKLDTLQERDRSNAKKGDSEVPES